MNNTGRTSSTGKLVLCAILTALVVILQLLGAFIRFGPFSISLVLIPIVIGAATCGTWAGAWLGFVFGVVVLINGDAALFLAINIPGTIATVLLKGIACGLAAGVAYNLMTKLLSKFKKGKQYFAVLTAALVCPIVNTGVFLIGCYVFFLDALREWATAAALGGGLIHYIIFGLIGGNFLFEIASNIVLSPIVVRLLNTRNKNV